MEKREKILEALEFFRKNECKVDIYDRHSTSLFSIWSNVEKRWIIDDANEYQLIEFYNKIT